MTKLFRNVSLLGSVLMAAAAETGSAKPAKSNKAKADTSKTKGSTKSAKPAAKVEEKKSGGGRKTPVFADKAKIHQALGFLKTNDMDGFTKAGFSQHHIRQLGQGVSGGMFGPGSGLGYVEMVKDESPRKEGDKSGRRPLVPRLTEAGKKFFQVAEMSAKRKAAASEKSESKSKAKPVETAPAAPAAQNEAPAQEPATEQPQTEATTSGDQAAA